MTVIPQTPTALRWTKPNRRGTQFKAGSKVCLAANVSGGALHREQSRVDILVDNPKYNDIVMVLPALGGFIFWHIDDLVLAKNVRSKQPCPFKW